ncbi:VanZ family protein [bacterium]|nr:VanZ family protein [bacterium]
MRPLRFLTLWLTFGCLLVALVICFSVIASPPEVHHFSGGDKLTHLLAYALVMLWFGLIFLPGRTYLILGFGFIVMGFALEITQGAIGYRSMEVLDMLSNTLGVLLGGLLARTRLSALLVKVENKLTKQLGIGE